MIRIALCTAFLVFCSSFLAQDQYNLVIFSEDGMPFTAYVNAVQQNESPSANILVTDLRSPNGVVKIVFANETAPDLKKNFFFQSPNTEVTLKITDTKKGLKLRYFGEVPIASSQAAPEYTVVYTETPVFVPVATPGGVSTTTHTTVHTETTNTDMDVIDDGDEIDVDVNIGGVSISMDVNMDGVGMDNGSYSSSTTTTTTTTTTSGNNTDAQVDYIIDPVMPDPPCPEVNMGQLRSTMANESFAEDKLNVAKQALKKTCVYVAQVKELAEMFSFEDDRLEFVKYAYDRTIDQEAFYEVNSVFTFSDSKEELNQFLENR